MSNSNYPNDNISDENSQNNDILSENNQNGEVKEESEAETTEKSSKKSPMKEILEWVEAIAIAVVLALIIRNFVFTVVRVDGQSMESTLQHNDRMIVWKLFADPEPGDIVVFKSAATDNNYWIKRVIATEGQHVRIDFDENAVYVDEAKLDEPYMNKDSMSFDDMEYNPGRDLHTDLIVPEGCVFVLGDNRNHSTDGRYIGPISIDCIEGEAVLRFWPFSNFSTY